MENRLISIILKAGMGVLFILGVYLIWTNISLAPSIDEDLALSNQSFFTAEYPQPNDEDGNRQEAKTEVLYSYVVDNDAKKVYDLENEKVYEAEAFTSSNGKVKKDIGELKEGTVNDVILKHYDFQNATTNSISYTKWLMIIAFVIIIGFTIVNIVIEPKRFLVSAIGVVALGIISTICYYIVETVGTGKMLETSNYTDTAYHYSGAGLMLCWVLATIAMGLIVYSWIVSIGRTFSN